MPTTGSFWPTNEIVSIRPLGILSGRGALVGARHSVSSKSRGTVSPLRTSGFATSGSRTQRRSPVAEGEADGLGTGRLRVGSSYDPTDAKSYIDPLI